MLKNTEIETKVKALLHGGEYDQHVIFNKLYPFYGGHYSRLRDIISKIKDKGHG
jgi:hypothetical protein